MFGLLQRKRGTLRPAEIPAGIRAYVIGDIHGRFDLLLRLHEDILTDAQQKPIGDLRIIYLGDYVDRGPSSREVLDFLTSAQSSKFSVTCLQGNHEAMLLRFLEDASVGPEWFAYGGLATLMSYGINLSSVGNTEEKLRAAQSALSERFPSAHKSFLESLPTHASLGDYFFVHAGVRPGVPLTAQKDTDLVWIREDFLASKDFHGKIVVHGHSYKTEPEVLPNRIGIDTGAYATGRLTCLVLEAQGTRFL